MATPNLNERELKAAEEKYAKFEDDGSARIRSKAIEGKKYRSIGRWLRVFSTLLMTIPGAMILNGSGWGWWAIYMAWSVAFYCAAYSEGHVDQCANAYESLGK